MAESDDLLLSLAKDYGGQDDSFESLEASLKNDYYKEASSEIPYSLDSLEQDVGAFIKRGIGGATKFGAGLVDIGLEAGSQILNAGDYLGTNLSNLVTGRETVPSSFDYDFGSATDAATNYLINRKLDPKAKAFSELGSFLSIGAEQLPAATISLPIWAASTLGEYGTNKLFGEEYEDIGAAVPQVLSLFKKPLTKVVGPQTKSGAIEVLNEDLNKLGVPKSVDIPEGKAGTSFFTPELSDDTTLPLMYQKAFVGPKSPELEAAKVARNELGNSLRREASPSYEAIKVLPMRGPIPDVKSVISDLNSAKQKEILETVEGLAPGSQVSQLEEARRIVSKLTKSKSRADRRSANIALNKIDEAINSSLTPTMSKRLGEAREDVATAYALENPSKNILAKRDPDYRKLDSNSSIKDFFLPNFTQRALGVAPKGEGLSFLTAGGAGTLGFLGSKAAPWVAIPAVGARIARARGTNLVKEALTEALLNPESFNRIRATTAKGVNPMILALLGSQAAKVSSSSSSPTTEEFPLAAEEDLKTLEAQIAPLQVPSSPSELEPLATEEKFYTNRPEAPTVKPAEIKKTYKDEIENAAALTGVDPNLIVAMIRMESSGKPKALSPKGASGLMQLMPDTAAEVHKKLGLKEPLDINDPFQNILLGAAYIKQQLNKFGDLKLSLAAYNAGPGNVQRHGGIPPFEETIAYADNVSKLFEALSLEDKAEA